MGNQSSSHSKKGSKKPGFEPAGQVRWAVDDTWLWTQDFSQEHAMMEIAPEKPQNPRTSEDLLMQILSAMLEDGGPDLERFIEDELDKYLDKTSYQGFDRWFERSHAVGAKMANSVNANVFSQGLRFVPYSVLHPAGYQENTTLETLLQGMALVLKAKNGHTYDRQEDEVAVSSLVDFLYMSQPAPCLTPPSTDFCRHGAGQVESFVIRKIYGHGLASSGSYLFCLSGESMIQIFSVTSGGSLTESRAKRLPFTLVEHASLTASNTVVRILNGETEYEINVDDLVGSQDTPAFRAKPAPLEVMCCLSDGITATKVSASFHVRVCDFGSDSIIRETSLTSGLDALAASAPQLLPATNWHLIPMASNGVFFSLILQVGGGKAINRIFSLVTGVHVRDEVFDLPGQLFAVTVDIANQCQWLLIMLPEGKIGIQKVYFAGSYDPYMFGLEHVEGTKVQHVPPSESFNMLFGRLNFHIFHFFGGQVVPKLFDCLVRGDVNLGQANFVRLVEITEQIIMEKQNLAPQAYKIALQVMAGLLAANMHRCLIKVIQELRPRLYQIIRSLPENLAVFLFFGRLNIWMAGVDPEAIKLMVELLGRYPTPIFTPSVLLFAFKRIEMSQQIAFVPFMSGNAMSSLLPQTTAPASSIPRSVQTLMILHQRALVAQTKSFLVSDPYATMDFKVSSSERTPLNMFKEYAMALITKFDAALQNCGSVSELLESFIWLLFDNFLQLLPVLIDYHSVAQLMTASLQSLIEKMSAYLSSPETSNQVLVSVIFNYIYIFGKFASTLFMGGGVTELEEEYGWVIRENLLLLDDADVKNAFLSDDVNTIFDETVRNFITYGDEVMTTIYSKFKPSFNRNLREDVRRVDKVSLVALAKHMHCLDELVNYNGSVPMSELLKSACGQMHTVRNYYRSLTQKESENGNELKNLLVKCIMLAKMTSDGNATPKSLSNFVTSSTSPETIFKILNAQKNRIQITLIGFALIERIYGMNISPAFTRIVGHTMSQVKSFEGLSSILRIKPLSQPQYQQVSSFFTKLVDVIARKQDNSWVMATLRFFHAVDGLCDIQVKFLDQILESYKSTPDRIPLFLLAFSLLRRMSFWQDRCQFQFDLSSPNISWWMLIAQAERSGLCVITDCASLLTSILESSGGLLHAKLLALAVALNKSVGQQVQDTLVQMVRRVGAMSLGLGGDSVSGTLSELINLLRGILWTPGTACDSLLSLYQNCPMDDRELVFGLLAIIGAVEPRRPLAVVKLTHDSEGDEYVLMVSENKQFRVRRPVTRHVELQEVAERMNMYVVPRYPVMLQTVIKDYMNKCVDTLVPVMGSVEYVVLNEALAYCCNFSEFVASLSPNVIEPMFSAITRFDDIYETQISAYRYGKMPVCEGKFGFSILRFTGVKTVTYLSPPILATSQMFQVNVHCQEGTRFFIGIVSDAYEKDQCVYNVIAVPSGETYPITSQSGITLTSPFDIVMDVDPQRKTFSVGLRHLEFPLGVQYRVIVACDLELEIVVPAYMSVFALQGTCPSVADIGVYCDESMFGPETEWANQYVGRLPADLESVSQSGRFLRIPVDDKTERLRGNFIRPPEFFLVHPGWATTASRQILDEMLCGAHAKLARQWQTIALMRVAKINPKRVKYVALKLLSALLLCLERYSPELVSKKRFPFDLGNSLMEPLSQVRTVHLGLQVEAKAALISLLQDDELLGEIYHQMIPWSESWRRHLYVYPNDVHMLIVPAGLNPRKQALGITMNSIICPNDFEGEAHWISVNGQQVSMPAIVKTDSQVEVNILTMIAHDRRFLSTLALSPNLAWVPHGPFELLLCLKACVHATKKPEHVSLAKSILMNCWLVNSPFVRLFLDEYLNFIEFLLPTSPVDNDPYYESRLILVAAQLKSSPNQKMLNFYSQQQHILSSEMAKSLSLHFLEFFSAPLQKPESDELYIKFGKIDPEAISGDFQSYIQAMRPFAKNYKSLVGFPFWDILPLWLRISGEYGSKEDYIPPSCTMLSGNVMAVSIPSDPDLFVTLVPRRRIPPDTLVVYSRSISFEPQEIVTPENFVHLIRLERGTTYFSCPDLEDPWSLITIMFNENRRAPSPDGANVQMSRIHDKFVADMEQFAVKWKETHTTELLNLFTRTDLQEPTFAKNEAIARASSLCSEFNATVVVLRALIIHHFNYIRYRHQDRLSQDLYENFTTFLCVDDALEAFVKAIAVAQGAPVVTVNRRAAQLLVAEKQTSSDASIIAQVAQIFKKHGPAAFRALPAPRQLAPWKVSFVGEEAIDQGGPCRELVTETATSIFEPTSGVVMPIPDDRKHNQRLTFIPVPGINSVIEERLWAIGVFIGIVIRTGLYQDMPFDPLVWRFLAGASLDETDILRCDTELATFFDNLRARRVETNWVVENWEGERVVLPSRQDIPVSHEDVPIYIRECVRYRISELMPALQAMRRGFRENIGLVTHPLMSGPVLSRLTQGNPELTTAHLKAITRFDNFDKDDPLIARYWRVVDRFTNEQRKLLLKFTTNLTRIPNSAIDPQFKVLVIRGQPSANQYGNQMLPVAATCFNKFILPPYQDDELCYRKILYAIQMCTTMERQ